MKLQPVALLLLLLPAVAFAATAKNGVVPHAALTTVRTIVGDYEGQWDTQVTAAAQTSISRYELTRPVLRLALDPEQHLTAAFFMDRDAAAANDPLDLLGFGCRSKVGPLLTLETHSTRPQTAGAPRVLLDATFDFDWGLCPSRVHAVASNDLRMRVAANDADREWVVSLALLRKVQADGRVYVNENGVRREVVVRPKADGRGSVYAPDLEYCVKNQLGEIERCFSQESELKRFIVPFPFPGFSAAWYTKKTPALEFEKGKKLEYHEAIFRRAFAD